MVTALYFHHFLKLKSGRIAPTTYKSYEDLINRFIIPFFGEKEIENISVLDVELFISALLGQNLAAGSVKRIFAVFRAAMRKAVKLGLINANPADSIDPLPRSRREIDFFSIDEVREILEILARKSEIWEVYFLISVDLGARRGEMVALTWKDVDFTENTVEIRRTAYKLAGAPAATKPPKSGKSRRVAVSALSMRRLAEWRRQQRKLCMKQGKGWKESFYIFSKTGEMMHPSSPSTWWRRFLAENGFPPKPLHSLRHTSATLLLANGVDLKTVSNRLGHSSIEVTDFYLHAVRKADAGAAAVMEKILYQTQ